MSKYEVIDTRNLMNQPWVKIIIDTLENKGTRRPYFIVNHVESGATVGLNFENNIILTYKYRHPIRETIYDLPAGGLHPGEEPIEGAHRELEEETGFDAPIILAIGYVNQFPGSMKAGTH